MNRQVNSIKLCVLILVLCVNTGCTSRITKVSFTPTPGQESLGVATGTACGSLLLFSIPLQLTSRVERAHQRAMESIPGATRLIEVTVNEYWYWWVFGTARCFTVTGEAIR